MVTRSELLETEQAIISDSKRERAARAIRSLIYAFSSGSIVRASEGSMIGMPSRTG